MTFTYTFNSIKEDYFEIDYIDTYDFAFKLNINPYHYKTNEELKIHVYKIIKNANDLNIRITNNINSTYIETKYDNLKKYCILFGIEIPNNNISYLYLRILQ